VVYNRISGKPVFDAIGEFRGYRGTGADVTALRTAEGDALVSFFAECSQTDQHGHAGPRQQ
jgi:hypothetical protein